MKKRLLITLSLLMIACMLLTSCDLFSKDNPQEQPDDNVNVTPCVHVDTDVNGKCDKCNADVEVPVQPEIDYSKDTAHAIEVFNQLVNGNMDIIPTGNFNATFKDFTIDGSLKDEFDYEDFTDTISAIALKDNVLYIKVKESEDTEIDVYYVFEKNGAYVLSTDGRQYQYQFSKYDDFELDMEIDETIDYTMKETDLTYDNETGYFIVNPEYINKLMSIDDEDNSLVVDDETIEQSIVDMDYVIKFKLDKQGNLIEFNVKATTTQENITTDVVAFVLTTSGNDFEISATLNVSYIVNIKISGKVIDTVYELKTSMTMTPPLGMGEPEDLSIILNMNILDKELTLSTEVQALMAKCKKVLDNYNKIEEKYNEPITVDCDCYEFEIYDKEYGIYVRFEQDYIEEGKYNFVDFNLENDPSRYCQGTLINGVVTIDKHCQYEIAERTAQEKYAGSFTGPVGCEDIIIYDSELGVYIYMEEDFFEEGVYEFFMFYTEMWTDTCVGTIDFITKTISVSEHSELHELLTKFKNIELTPVGEFEDWDQLSVYCEEIDMYILFTYYEGEIGYMGYSSWNTGIEAIINFENNTIAKSNS